MTQLTDDAPRASGMPMLGLGTWQNDDPERCERSVRSALELGYRHVDTAQGYDNEAAVGDGIESAAVDRSQVFLATKVRSNNLAREDVLDSARESRERLGVGTIDLLYVHWPTDTYDPEETLPAMAELRGDVTERIGVSNFEPENLDTARDVLDASIFANQVECHPLLPQEELRSYCADAGIEVVAYSPLARGEVFDVEEIRAVAERHDASPAQVSLAWLREKGVTAIPKAADEDHVRDNWESLELDLDGEDVERIDGIERRHRCIDPDDAPWN